MTLRAIIFSKLGDYGYIAIGGAICIALLFGLVFIHGGYLSSPCCSSR